MNINYILKQEQINQMLEQIIALTTIEKNWHLIKSTEDEIIFYNSEEKMEFVFIPINDISENRTVYQYYYHNVTIH